MTETKKSAESQTRGRFKNRSQEAPKVTHNATKRARKGDAILKKVHPQTSGGQSGIGS